MASTILPRYQRRLPEVNEAVVATYLAGGNTRRIRGALAPLLKAAPSPRARSPASWRRSRRSWRLAYAFARRPRLVYLYLDAFALRVRSAGRS